MIIVPIKKNYNNLQCIKHDPSSHKQKNTFLKEFIPFNSFYNKRLFKLHKKNGTIPISKKEQLFKNKNFGFQRIHSHTLYHFKMLSFLLM